MKLRFRANSLRFRVNQKEVQALADGMALNEHVIFPGNASLAYIVEAGAQPQATFNHGVIRITALRSELIAWAGSDEIGLYFDLPAGDGTQLKVAIEKDLECIDGPPEEADMYAFPRAAETVC